MLAIFQEFIAVIGSFILFVQDYLIPDTASNVNILHVAVWLPVTLGLLGATASFLRSFWSRSGRRA